MTFLAKTSSSSEWKVVASTISALIEEATFEAKPEGITFRAMDPSHVALVDLLWPSSAFEKYKCDKEFKFSIRIEDLSKLIRRTDVKDSIEITTSDEQTLVLKFSNGYKRQYSLHLIESTYGPTPIPKLSFNTKITMIEKSFERLLSDVSVVSDHLIIESSKEKMVFSGKSDRGTGSMDLDKNSNEILDLDVKENSKGIYNLDFLLSIAKAAGPGSENVVLEYSSKMPIKMEFKLGDLGGRMIFYLAPRVDDR